MYVWNGKRVHYASDFSHCNFVCSNIHSLARQSDTKAIESHKSLTADARLQINAAIEIKKTSEKRKIKNKQKL